MADAKQLEERTTQLNWIQISGVFCSLLLTLLGLDRSPSLSTLANTQQIQFINRYLEENTAILLSEQYLYRCRNGERAHVCAHTAHSKPICIYMACVLWYVLWSKSNPNTQNDSHKINGNKTQHTRITYTQRVRVCVRMSMSTSTQHHTLYNAVTEQMNATTNKQQQQQHKQRIQFKDVFVAIVRAVNVVVCRDNERNPINFIFKTSFRLSILFLFLISFFLCDFERVSEKKLFAE